MLEAEGLAGERLGVDMAETGVFLALQAEGLNVVDGQQAMMKAREIKSPDEIILLTQACAMVDGVYQDIFEALKPGIRESDVVGLARVSSRWAQSSSRRSTRSPARDAARTRMSSPTA